MPVALAEVEGKDHPIHACKDRGRTLSRTTISSYCDFPGKTPPQYFALPRLFHVESMEWGVESMEWGMDSILLVDGFHTFSKWIPYLFKMDSIPFPGGFHTFQMDSILLPYGIQVE